MQRAVLAASWLLMGACSKDDSGLGPAATDSIELPAPILSARRPTARFYMERTSDRCSMYSVEGDVKSAPSDEPCPEDLQLGERIRLVGMTCVKDGDAGTMPILCPVALLRFERSVRRAAASAAASESSSRPPASASAAKPSASR